MAIDSTSILNQMSDIRHEPTRMASIVMSLVEQQFDGKSIMVDPSLPFPYLIEISTVMTAAAIEEDRLLNSEQYPTMANSEDELYNHLSDKGYVGMYGTPADGWFDFMMSVEEVIANAVQVGNTGTKKLVIPKHTQVLANNIPFTFQYPITFIVKKHGDIDVVIDGSMPSPFQTLSGNKPKWNQFWIDTESAGRVKMVRVQVKLKQILLTSYKHSLTGAKSLKKTVPLTNQFFYCRAFSKNSVGKWIEIKTTNSQQVFDPMDPTLLYKVVDGDMTYELPYVYFTTGLTLSEIRVDVYTFNGPLNIDLGDFGPESFIVTWSDLDQDDNYRYSAPLDVMSTISIVSTDPISGGTNAPTFEQRREKVLNNAVGEKVIPISDAQMGTALQELGFDAMANIDVLTNRTYLATKPMPVDTNSQASFGIDSAVITAKKSITDLLSQETVVNNHPHYTITPDTLYRNIDGVLRIVSDNDRRAIDRLRGDALVNTVSDGTYLYTPLHYVLDISDDEFEVRPYYLTSPSFDIVSYEASNDTLGLTILSSSSRTVTWDGSAYVISIKSQSNAAWKALRDDQVHVQMAFIPNGESDRAYINGVQVAKGDERWFEFRIKTNLDLDKNHYLTSTNFNMYEAIERQYPVALDMTFDLIWSVSDYTVDGAEGSDVDLVLGRFLLPDEAVGVYWELLNINLGAELSGLWARSRSMIGLRKYQTYPADVFEFYATNVYEKDENDRPIIEDDPDNPGDKRLKIKHKKGDQKFNADGEPEIKHAAGSVVRDENGDPVMEDERNILRWWDMCLFDAVYRYATRPNDVTYRSSVPTILTEWINDVLGPLREDLLENTQLLFQPRNTIKYVECTVDDSELKTLLTSQYLTIDLFVSKDVYNNSSLRAALKSSAIAQVVSALDSIIVAKDKIQDDIRDNLGTDVISVRLSGLGGVGNDFDVVQVNDESSRLGIGKSLAEQADATYAVVDAIEVNFKLHSRKTA